MKLIVGLYWLCWFMVEYVKGKLIFGYVVLNGSLNILFVIVLISQFENIFVFQKMFYDNFG